MYRAYVPFDFYSNGVVGQTFPEYKHASQSATAGLGRVLITRF